MARAEHQSTDDEPGPAGQRGIKQNIHGRAGQVDTIGIGPIDLADAAERQFAGGVAHESRRKAGAETAAAEDVRRPLDFDAGQGQAQRLLSHDQPQHTAPGARRNQLV